ncbi:hypothetical protein [Streptomyces sp. 058-1L]|uniref:hypothetical protein n=1 Tax=Streptomyces sp. 058-1L TaxID=2789266 RepID=UPI00398010D3
MTVAGPQQGQKLLLDRRTVVEVDDLGQLDDQVGLVETVAQQGHRVLRESRTMGRPLPDADLRLPASPGFDTRRRAVLRPPVR